MLSSSSWIPRLFKRFTTKEELYNIILPYFHNLYIFFLSSSRDFITDKVADKVRRAIQQFFIRLIKNGVILVNF